MFANDSMEIIYTKYLIIYTKFVFRNKYSKNFNKNGFVYGSLS